MLPAVLAALVAVALVLADHFAPHGHAVAGPGTPSPSASVSAPASAPPSAAPARPSSPDEPSTKRRSPDQDTGVLPVAPPDGPAGTARGTPGPGDAGKPAGRARTAALTIGAEVRLQDAGAHLCVQDTGSVYAQFGTCTGSDTFVWSLHSEGGGTFTLVNRASTKCLIVTEYGGQPGIGDCADPTGLSYVQWRLGTATTTGQQLVSLPSRKCLVIAPPYPGNADALLLDTCAGDQPRQRWRNADS